VTAAAVAVAVAVAVVVAQVCRWYTGRQCQEVYMYVWLFLT
jgi:hypothetical protein